MVVSTCTGKLHVDGSKHRGYYNIGCATCGWQSADRATLGALAKLVGMAKLKAYQDVPDLPHVKATMPPEMVNGLRCSVFYFPHMETMEEAFARMAARVKKAEREKVAKWWRERMAGNEVASRNDCPVERFDDATGEWVTA